MKKKYIYFLLINTILFSILSCVKEFKEGLDSSETAFVGVSIAPLVTDERDFDFLGISSNVPSAVSGFTCLILNVTGSKIAKTQNLGLISSQIAVENGGMMVIEVPKANGMVFQVLGIKSQVGCPARVTKESLLSIENYPIVTVLGSLTADIQGDRELIITNSYNQTLAKDLRTGSLLVTPQVEPPPVGNENPPPPPSIGAPPSRPEGTLGNFVFTEQEIPVPLQGASAVEVGNKLYIIGGFNHSGGGGDDDDDDDHYGGLPSYLLRPMAFSTIYQATIDENGNIGAVTESPHNLNFPRAYFQTHVIGNYLYVIGGVNSALEEGTHLYSIERASINSQGISSEFTVLSQRLVTGRSNFASVVSNGYVHVIGGNYYSTPYVDSIERAPLNTTTGEIGNFVALTRNAISETQAQNGLVLGRSTHNSFRLGNNYYILGGENVGSLDSIEKSVIQDDGTLGDFVTDSISLATARNRLSVIALSGFAYLYQGWDGGFLSSVERSTISNNTLANFSTLDGITLALAVEDAVSVVTSSAVFIIGGYNGEVTSKIQRAPIIPFL